jgi:epsilon-lactone hydrolase
MEAMMSESEIAALRTLLTLRPRPASVAERRERLDALGHAYPTAADISRETVSADGVPAEWTVAPGADASRVLLYLHGGGFSVGSIVSHRAMVAETGRAAQARTLAIDYRRTPEHPFPAALDDALKAYRWLLAQGVQPGRVAIGGDSAGGGLTLALMVALREHGLPLPACGWCISPWVDMEALGESFTDRAAADPTVQKETIQMMAQWYLGGANPRHPHAAPIYGDLRGLPPLLIQVGAAETLLDDSIVLARKAGAADVLVDLQIWPEMIHIWHIFFPMLSAGGRAIASGGTFVRNALRGE